MKPIIERDFPASTDLIHGKITSDDVPANLCELCDVPFEGLYLRPAENGPDKIIKNAFVLEMDDPSPIAKAAGVEAKKQLATIDFSEDKIRVHSTLQSGLALQRLERVITSLMVAINTNARKRAAENDADFLSLKEKRLPVDPPRKTSQKIKSPPIKLRGFT
jgi:hypothetical protein